MTGNDGTPTGQILAHLFEKDGRSFLFDTSTSCSFELDVAGVHAVCKLLGKDTGSGPADAGGESQAEVTTAMKELRELRDHGFFRDREVRVRSSGVPRRHSIVGAVVSRKCNLRCAYCFADKDKTPQMSRSVMEATAEFVASHTSQFATSHTVSFSGVGEITSDLAQYHAFSELLTQAGARYGIKLDTAISDTNLTTGNDSVVAGILRGQGPPMVTASLDGPPEAHNAARTYADGRGTYDDVVRSVEWLRSIGHAPNAQATLTALYPDVSEIYFHLFDLGFSWVAVKPVRAEPHQPHAIGRNLAAICAAYDRFADRLLTMSDADLLRILRIIGVGSHYKDYFGRFLARVMEKHFLHARCPAWVDWAVADTDGQLYGCYHLLGISAARIGSVWEGIDHVRVEELAEQTHVSHREPCRTCWARYVCGGGCMHQSYLTFGEFKLVDPDECKLNRHLIELAIWMLSEMQRTRPTVVSALRRRGPAERGMGKDPTQHATGHVEQ